MELIKAKLNELDKAIEIINMAKEHLREQKIDQWQNGYPDEECIKNDLRNEKGYFVKDHENILGYLCIDFDSEPAYTDLKGKWNYDESYTVVHRMAFKHNARGKNLADKVFRLLEEFSKLRGVHYFRVDTDSDNKKMQHILKKNGFVYCGKIWFDNSEKIAFDKKI
ncbi:MAG: GNAT family N-acetyltransferase [Candidatus Epulonipiscioides saccharophilum]|nr:MAG: GNAT family N-acetyltransferase [Epulopiscium sp. AS2M-Bin001]